MKVMLLGGSGGWGRPVASFLARSDLVSELLLGGRRLAAVEDVAAALGPKARAVQVDARDESRVCSLLAGCDLLVHASGPHYETLLPALRAAIQAQVDVCDLSDGARAMRAALALDAEAKEAGIVALLGIGLSPGITNLLAKHAYNQLERVEELHLVTIFDRTMAEWRQVWRGAIIVSLLESASGLVPIYRDGAWVDIVGHEHGVDVPLPGGRTVRAYPNGFPEPVTLPRWLPSLRNVSYVEAFLPARVGEIFHGQVRRITEGACTPEQAAERYYAALDAEPDTPPTPPSLRAPLFAIAAQGYKDGQQVSLTCTSGLQGAGTAALAAAALKLLRGEIQARGVLAPEACLAPLPFLAEVAQLLPETSVPADGQLITESLEPAGSAAS
jgi:lysine 6-dehydrogenase